MPLPPAPTQRASRLSRKALDTLASAAEPIEAMPDEPSPELVQAKPAATRRRKADTAAVRSEPVVASAPAAAPAKPAATPAKPEKSEKPAPAKPANDGAKAKALLEGKAAAADHAKVILQVGAFSDADKVREVRRKLEQAGLKTYTQVVDKDGKKSTRVRVGPYDSRADADKAAARIRKLDLPVSVLTH